MANALRLQIYVSSELMVQLQNSQCPTLRGQIVPRDVRLSTGRQIGRCCALRRMSRDRCAGGSSTNRRARRLVSRTMVLRRLADPDRPAHGWSKVVDGEFQQLRNKSVDQLLIVWAAAQHACESGT